MIKRRTPGVSLYHPPRTHRSALRRYAPIAAVGGLIGVTAGLGLTLMPAGQIAAVTAAPDAGSKAAAVDGSRRGRNDDNGTTAKRERRAARAQHRTEAGGNRAVP